MERMLVIEMVTFWHWWALAGGLMAVELFARGFVFLWLGAAAALVGLALLGWAAMPVSLQFVLFAGLAFSSLLAWRRFRARTADPREIGRQSAGLVGRRASLLDPIRDGRGRVLLGDDSWTVAGPDLPAGAAVEVTGADGALLQVRPI